jgi:hypothetical protein
MVGVEGKIAVETPTQSAAWMSELKPRPPGTNAADFRDTTLAKNADELSPVTNH